MLYAVIHDNRLIALRAKRDDAKTVALEVATAGVKCADHAFLYEKGGGERCELLYRADRRRRWTHSGYFVDAADLTS